MNNIVGIGANVFDTLYTVDTFPKEDTKMGATSKAECGGGPCATGLVAASKLGIDKISEILKETGKKIGVEIRIQLTDIFEAMHRI